MSIVSTIILNLSTLLSAYYALSRKYESKTTALWFKIGFMIIVVIAQDLISRLNIPIVNLCTTLLILYFMTKLFFRCKKYSFLLYDVLLYICIFCADIVSVIAISTAINSTIDNTLYNDNLMVSRYLLDSILIIILNVIVSTVFQKSTGDHFRWYEVASYILLACFETSSAAYISQQVAFSSSGTFLIYFLIGCFALDVYLVVVFYQLAKGRNAEKNYALIQQQSQIQLSVYQKLSQKYKDSMAIVHDAKKHITALKELIDSNEADRYCDALERELHKLTPTFQHKNKMLSVIINHALFKAEKEKIQLELHIGKADISFLTEMDLTTILANLLDNSIEACGELPENRRHIKLYIEQRIGFVLFHVSNPYTTIELLHNKEYRSTKKGHMGVGLSNVHQTVEKYHGVYDANVSNDWFTVSISIPIPLK